MDPFLWGSDSDTHHLLHSSGGICASVGVAPLAVRAAIALGFCLALRRSEYVESKGHAKLLRRHVRFLNVDGRPALAVLIHGKTDHHMGAERVSGDIPNDVMDPVALMRDHLASSPGGPDDPLFVYGSDVPARCGKRVPGDHISAWLKHCARHFGFNPDEYASHSLRIGCATALAELSKEDSLIMQVGRWKSMTFMIYLRRTPATFAPLAAEIASTNVHALRVG